MLNTKKSLNKTHYTNITIHQTWRFTLTHLLWYNSCRALASMGIEPTILGISSYRFSPLSYPVVLRFESDVFFLCRISFQFNIFWSGIRHTCTYYQSNVHKFKYNPTHTNRNLWNIMCRYPFLSFCSFFIPTINLFAPFLIFILPVIPSANACYCESPDRN